MNSRILFGHMQAIVDVRRMTLAVLAITFAEIVEINKKMNLSK